MPRGKPVRRMLRNAWPANELRWNFRTHGKCRKSTAKRAGHEKRPTVCGGLAPPRTLASGLSPHKRLWIPDCDKEGMVATRGRRCVEPAFENLDNRPQKPALAVLGHGSCATPLESRVYAENLDELPANGGTPARQIDDFHPKAEWPEKLALAAPAEGFSSGRDRTCSLMVDSERKFLGVSFEPLGQSTPLRPAGLNLGGPPQDNSFH